MNDIIYRNDNLVVCFNSYNDKTKEFTYTIFHNDMTIENLTNKQLRLIYKHEIPQLFKAMVAHIKNYTQLRQIMNSLFI